MRKLYALSMLTLLTLLAASSVSAQAQAPNGRWEFAIIKGDTTTSLQEIGQSTISMYLNVDSKSGNITHVPAWTTDTFGVDQYCCDVTVSGNFNFKTNKVTLTYNQIAVPAVGNVAATYVFSGTYQTNQQNGDVSNNPIIVGTYTSNDPTWSTSGGSFVATWFPDFPSNGQLEYVGSLLPDLGTGAEVPALINLGQDPSTHLLTGNILIGMTNSQGVACFTSPILQIQEVVPSQIVSYGTAQSGYSYTAGVGETIYATDPAGDLLWLLGYSAAPNGDSAAVGENYLCGGTFEEAEENPYYQGCTDNQASQTPSPFDGITFSKYQHNNERNNGTNNTLIFWYIVTGGPCDGMGGSDAPFHLVNKPQHGTDGNGQKHHHNYQHSGNGHHN